jgi:hypothetical protein
MISKEQKIKAIEDSIEHWENDIVNPLKEGKSIMCIDDILYWKDTEGPVPCYNADCPLCALYFTGLSTCFESYSLSSPFCLYDCPLESCGSDSTWMKFHDNPNLKTAQEVVYELKGTLIMEDIKDE